MAVARIPTVGDDDKLRAEFMPDLDAADVGADPAGAAAAAQAAAATDATSKVVGHAEVTAGVHGIADTSVLETTTGAQAKATAAQSAAVAAAATDATTKAAAAQAFAIQRANHTGALSADALSDGTTNKAFLATERTKLAGVATGATANATDAQLRDRGTHTGTQAHTTITGLGDAAAKNVGTTPGTVASGDIASVVAATTHASSYTLVLADAGTVVEVTAAGATNVTVPPNSSVAFPVGTVIEVVQYGAGQVTIVAGAGVTLRTPSTLLTRAQYSAIGLRKRATNEWVVAGDTTS